MARELAAQLDARGKSQTIARQAAGYSRNYASCGLICIFHRPNSASRAAWSGQKRFQTLVFESLSAPLITSARASPPADLSPQSQAAAGRSPRTRHGGGRVCYQPSHARPINRVAACPAILAFVGSTPCAALHPFRLVPKTHSSGHRRRSRHTRVSCRTAGRGPGHTFLSASLRRKGALGCGNVESS